MKKLLEDLMEIAGNRVSASLAERYCYSSDASQIIRLTRFLLCDRRTQARYPASCICAANAKSQSLRGEQALASPEVHPLFWAALSLNMSGMNRIIEIDIENQQVIVEPGAVHEKLNLALKPAASLLPA